MEYSREGEEEKKHE